MIDYISPALSGRTTPGHYDRILVTLPSLECLTCREVRIDSSGTERIIEENEIMYLKFELEAVSGEKLDFRVYGKRDIQDIMTVFQASNIARLRSEIDDNRRIWMYFDKNDIRSVRGIEIGD